MIGGLPVLDTHHHLVPEPVFGELVTMAAGAPRLVTDRISMTLSADLYRIETHLRVMDDAGIDVALLTYSGLSVFGAGLCRRLNEAYAEIVSAHYPRFVGAAHVALDDPVEARSELQRCVDRYGFGAVALPTSAPGIQLDDPRLAPLWGLIADLDIPVVLHPALLPAGAPTDYGLERSCARPFDTTLCAVRLLCGVFPRHQRLRCVLPHCGGTSVFLKGRLAMFYAPPGTAVSALPRTVSEQRQLGYAADFEARWQQFCFDTAGNGGWAPAVQMTAGIVGADRLMFGSDYPLESHSAATMRELLSVINDISPAASRAAVLGRNAAALLGCEAALRAAASRSGGFQERTGSC